MKKSYYTILLSLLPFIALSQQQRAYKIIGTIADSADQKVVPYATITAVKLPEKSIKKQLAAQADGTFDMPIDSAGEYLLTISALGYRTVSKNVLVEGGHYFNDLGIVPINTNSIELKPVTITAYKPLVKVESDKLVYSVESDLEAKTSNGLEVIKKVPTLVVRPDEKIQVNGSTNVKIYINGRTSSMATKNLGDFLQNTPASLIKSIEVISKPGAKFDAEGTGAIINIVMRKKPIGYSCSLSSSVSFSSSPYARNGLNFTTAFGRFGASINILNKSYYPEEIYDRNIYRENYGDDDQKYTNGVGKVHNRWVMLVPNIDISYDIDTLNLINLSLNSAYNRSKDRYSANVGIENTNNLLQHSYSYNSSYLDLEKELNGSISYQNISKKDKRKILTLSYQIDHLPMELRNEMDIDSIKDYKSAKQISRNNESWTEHTFQVDYTLPLCSKGEVETGSKYISREDRSSSHILDYQYSTNQFVENTGMNNDFSYKQGILAAYLTYSLKIDRLSFKLGLRAEDSKVSCVFTSANTTGFNNSVKELVPSTSISYQLTEGQNLGLSYTKKIKRPSVWHLNPYVDKSDPNNFHSGNPSIKAEHFHSLELSYGSFGQFGNFSISLDYMRSNDGIEQEIKQVDAGTILTTFDNIAKVQNWISSASLMLKIGKDIRLQLSSSVNYNDLENKNTTARGLGYDISSDIEYRIVNGLKFSVSGFYLQEAKSLQSKTSALYYTNFTLKKEFLQKRLIVSLLYSNAFWKHKNTSYEVFDDTFYQVTKEVRQGYLYGFRISYSFGKLENEIKKVVRVINNDDIKGKGK
ncbi:MAG: TonB-dependent receptor [Bacteroidales bacterium]|nr:TonB-dependent receptor [Bacteroidales bacterium]